MTKTEFKQAMMCGLGRCIIELQSTADAKKYFDFVMWGCTHNFAYDTQCEGTRAWYVWQMTKCFKERKIFVNAVIERMENYHSNGSWLFSHYCDLLYLFAQDGFEEAKAALCKKYSVMYQQLLETKRLSHSIFPLRDDFESLCVLLSSDSLDSYIHITEDIGNLFLQTQLFDGYDFDWMFEHAKLTFGAKRTMNRLNSESHSTPAISAYVKEKQRCAKEFEENKKKQKETESLDIESFLNSDDILVLGIARRFLQKGKSQVGERLAKIVLDEPNPERKAKILRSFAAKREWCRWPLSPEPLIELAKSGQENLSYVAMQVLENIRDEAVRKFALELLKSGIQDDDAINLLAQNYQKCDHDVFVNKVKSLLVTTDGESGWHGAFMSVQDMFDKDGVKDAPKELLRHLYDHSLCSSCRFHTLRIMGQRRMITDDIWAECKYDTNDDIRAYVNNHFQRLETT